MATSHPVEASASVARAQVRLRCWGDFALTDSNDGTDIKPRGRKARALLAYLALHPGKSVSRERLTGLLWGGRGEEQARASLRQAILELKPLSTEPRSALAIERDHLSLTPGTLTTDLQEMSAAVGAGDYDALLELLPDSDERLFANLDGIDEAFDDWLTIERSRQSDALVTLIADASAAALAEGQTRHARMLHARRRELDPEGGLAPAASLSPESGTPLVAKTADAPKTAPSRLSLWLLPMALALAAVLAGGAWYLNRAPASAATVVVLPFKGLPAENASFAEGLSDEITAQLGRQPGLRVAGRTSASQFRNGAANLIEIGRKLGVSYALEGTVRSDGNHVRVNVALAKTSDGIQLWSDTFDGTLDDVLAIQYRIGESVAEALNVRLARKGVPSGSLATSGQVYSLYLNARGLIRQRNSKAFEAARERLWKAVRLDPHFAPAWSSLAQAENPGGLGKDARARTDRAISFAEKALALAPDLPEAHGVLGMLYGFEDPRGVEHIERAATLDPTNAEYQFWLGNVRAMQFDFSGMLSAYRRAYELDTLWVYPQMMVVQTAWELGLHDEALGYLRRVDSDDSAYDSHVVRSALAHAQGDLSAEAMEWSRAAAATADPGRRGDAIWSQGMVYDQLGLVDLAYEMRRSAGALNLVAPGSDPLALIRSGRLPSSSEIESRNRNIPVSWQDTGFVGRAAKVLINAGRASEIVRLYDGPGILQISRRRLPGLPARWLQDGPVVAAALKAVGRNSEADRILANLERQIESVLRRSAGRARPGFLAHAAQTWALQGKTDKALATLERVGPTGWASGIDYDDSSLADFGDEPAFEALRGQPRFEAVRRRFNDHMAKERREALSQLRH